MENILRLGEEQVVPSEPAVQTGPGKGGFGEEQDNPFAKEDDEQNEEASPQHLAAQLQRSLRFELALRGSERGGIRS